jgi:hypothetical protein
VFKKHNFVGDAKDQYELKIFNNIRKFGIHRVADHAFVFPTLNPSPGDLNTLT